MADENKSLKELMQQIAEQLQEQLKINSVTIADFQVQSSQADLPQLEKSISRMIRKHKDFATMRRSKNFFENSAGYYG